MLRTFGAQDGHHGTERAGYRNDAPGRNAIGMQHFQSSQDFDQSHADDGGNGPAPGTQQGRFAQWIASPKQGRDRSQGQQADKRYKQYVRHIRQVARRGQQVKAGQRGQNTTRPRLLQP